jgi:hypothetical protein
MGHALISTESKEALVLEVARRYQVVESTSTNFLATHSHCTHIMRPHPSILLTPMFFFVLLISLSNYSVLLFQENAGRADAACMLEARPARSLLVAT